MDVASRVKQLREENNISQNKLATLAELSQGMVRQIELGEKNPTIQTVEKICNGLGITLSDFFTPDKPHLADLADRWHKKISLSVRDEKAIIEKLRDQEVMAAAIEQYLPAVREKLVAIEGNNSPTVKKIDAFTTLTIEEQIDFLHPLLEEVIVTEDDIGFISRGGIDPDTQALTEQILKLSERDRQLVWMILDFLSKK